MEQFKEKCTQYLLLYHDLDVLNKKKFKTPEDIQTEELEFRRSKKNVFLLGLATLVCFIARYFVKRGLEGFLQKVLAFLAMAIGVVLVICFILRVVLCVLNLKNLNAIKKSNEKRRQQIAAHEAKTAKLKAACETLFVELKEERKSFPELKDRKCFFDEAKAAEKIRQKSLRWSINEVGALDLRLVDVYNLNGQKYDYQNMEIHGNYRKGKLCLISEIMPYFDPVEYTVVYCDREYIEKNPCGKCTVWELESYMEEMRVEKIENSNAFFPEKTLETIESARNPLEKFIYSGLNGKENLSSVPDDRRDEDSYQSSKLVTSETNGWYRHKELRLHRYGYIVRTPDCSRIICAVAPRQIPPEYKISFNFYDEVSMDEAYGYRMGKVIGLSRDNGPDAEESHLPAEVMLYCAYRAADDLKAIDVLSPIPESMSNMQWRSCLASIIKKRQIAK